MFYKLVSCHAILFCLYFLRAQLRIENVWNIFSYNVFWGSHIDILLFTNCIFLICFVAFAFIEELQPMWGTRNSMKGCNKWFSLPGPQGYFQAWNDSPTPSHTDQWSPRFCGGGDLIPWLLWTHCIGRPQTQSSTKPLPPVLRLTLCANTW
jgi:hypothetical protein